MAGEEGGREGRRGGREGGREGKREEREGGERGSEGREEEINMHIRYVILLCIAQQLVSTSECQSWWVSSLSIH